ncbi:response regulator [Caballeronia terrestris]|uniref:response regulator n=1 Tax=Caballeronia terrestris TaxID=1226301 RepID=UPI0035B50406
MTVVLELDGHEVRTVYSGEEAVEIFNHFTPEVVLLDLGLPGMSGIAVARTIRTVPSTKDVTLIAITGWGQPQDRVRTAEAGFDFHFTKPVDVAQLKQAIVLRGQPTVVKNSSITRHGSREKSRGMSGHAPRHSRCSAAFADCRRLACVQLGDVATTG